MANLSHPRRSRRSRSGAWPCSPRSSGKDKSFGNPTDDMTMTAHEALAAVEKVGPLFAAAQKDARALLNDIMAKIEQVAHATKDSIRAGSRRDAAMRRRDDELRKQAGAIRGRRTKLAAHVDGLPKVLRGQGVPNPTRANTAAK